MRETGGRCFTDLQAIGWFSRTCVVMWSETRSRLFDFLAHGLVSMRKIYHLFIPFYYKVQILE